MVKEDEVLSKEVQDVLGYVEKSKLGQIIGTQKIVEFGVSGIVGWIILLFSSSSSLMVTVNVHSDNIFSAPSVHLLDDPYWKAHDLVLSIWPVVQSSSCLKKILLFLPLDCP